MAGQMVGGAFLSASLQVLFDRMASLQVIDFIRGKRLNEGLFKKLKIKLLSAHFVLNDAEQKQIWNPAVREWFHELQEAIYDAEDLVDEINTEALRCRVEAEYGRSSSSNPDQVLNLFYTRTSTTSIVNEQVEYKMVEILDRLEFILDQKDTLGLQGGVLQTKPSRRLPTTSSVEKAGIFGRNGDKEAFIKLLLTDNGSGINNNFSVIPIVGMGGIGKTTLAQLVYNDERVKNFFEIRSWVFVSEEFDVFKITKTIKERVTSRVSKGQDLDLLQVQLEKALREKKFLLVLDDVWNEDYFMWEELKKPFECGAYGSKIIVTTRSENVASVMCKDVPSYQLESISNENCWRLFVKHAFNNVDPCAHPKLEEIGKQIVLKCKGLPLAVKLHGCLLHNQLDPEEWEKILESDMWELPKEKNKILPALWLSYHYLPSHLKRCFAYCSVFPKNYEIDKEDLIKLWMAEDLIKAQKNKRIEEVGEEYVKDLLSRSLFRQVLREPWYGKSSICYTMHDLVHDLATFVAGEFCLSLDVSNSNKFLSKVRHLSHENEKGHKYDLKKYEHLFRAKSLRNFFFPLECYGGIQLQLQDLVTIKLLPELKCLRVLSLKGSSISELPDSIGHLKLLRYLNLSKTRIKEMPMFLCALYNLQTLILSHCGQLKLLPTDMGRLINLRHLDITNTSLERMPLEIGNLKDLQTLPEFVVGKHCGYTLKLLHDLQHLQGKLCFSELNNIGNLEDTLVANLKDKKYLTELEFWWDYFDPVENYQMHSEVLNGLEPSVSLKSLKVENYRGQQFPKWVGDPSFCNLEDIRLGGCGECSTLPSLGQLPFLKCLVIEGFDELVKIGDEFCCRNGSSVMARPFRSLEVLQFYNLQKWEEWPYIDQLEGAGAFPNLKKLVLGCCPNLTVCLCLPNSIEEVSIIKCRKVELLGMQQLYENLGKLHIEESCDALTSIVLDYFPVLEELTLESCENLESLTCSEQSHPPALLSLTTFELKGCAKFVSFPHGGLHAPNLETFCIVDCIKMRSLPQLMHTLLPSLQSLSLTDCPELESYPECRLPSNLIQLKISNCKKLFANCVEWNLQTLHSLHSLNAINMDEMALELFPEEGLLPTALVHLHIDLIPHLKALNGKAIQHLSFLKRLAIYRCEELQCLPEEGLPASLSELTIVHCPLLKQRCQRDTGEDWSKISHIAYISIDYYRI